jgi:hypothetical protein
MKETEFEFRTSDSNTILNHGQKFPTNRFVENFIQPTYKIDMCPLACEKYVLIAYISHMLF